MAKEDEKVALPASYGGIVRYFEEFEGRIKLKPQHVILLAIAVIFLVLFLFLLNPLGLRI
ncbi:MAG: preprotein translocase subunit Sec61beta [Candidatus Nanoarchaeia archaeon]|nr:preprotein translocase subunit Sec61beta [Candidatus Haiyanarchaeum thermophilum]MCW1303185.1 preprotein translocase subunit Sec61beta [Candidatus Haiyanarchaeum thermophilum]MCW1303851.1 preprotein translocase subunit Sec61beta [Candidatus Haiyanarchaeum thermophilum]MCW1306533.1 preprotein translocase subunit Sec61beta [Candidatus Haiyanarchaeum thermophilum]MCW1306946.1 preprotein translocase subunit Sec61beta [Candidatus Haiyanarchaeum thermophilum]